jgi:maleylacetoacetate isomerase
MRVQQYLERSFGVPQADREDWIRHWIRTGFEPLEELLTTNPSTGSFCEGDAPSLADICLIPQVYNALRFKVDMAPYPTIRRIYETCLKEPAFDDARPEKQPDAPGT